MGGGGGSGSPRTTSGGVTLGAKTGSSMGSTARGGRYVRRFLFFDFV